MASGALAQPCHVASTDPAIAPAPRSESQWSPRHHHQKLAVAQYPAHVVMIGDSMIQRWPPEMLKTAFQGDKIINLGIGGDQTQHVLWRLNDLDLLHQNPAYAVLMVGANNMSRNGSACSTFTGIAHVLAKLRHKLPQTKIIIIEILPRGQDYAFRKVDIADVNTKLKTLEDPKTVFMDPSSIVQGAASEGHINQDLLHLSPSGYQALTTALINTVARNPFP